MERTQLREIRRAWDRIQPETRRIFDYIRREIASGRRTPADVAFLRETRALHFRPYSQKEATQ